MPNGILIDPFAFTGHTRPINIIKSDNSFETYLLMSTASPTTPVPCDNRRMLIADDESSVRSIFRMLLHHDHPDYTFDTASNGLEAIQSFQQYHQAVLVMDMKMPQMDGPAAFEKIRDFCEKNNWALPGVIFCTGLIPSAEDSSLPLQGAQCRIIQKPVTRNALLAAVNSYLT